MPTMPAAQISSLAIRDACGQAEVRAIEELQKEVWGIPEIEVVPATQLVAAQAAGGVLLGAFDGETLAGFAYGFLGLEHGQATHHSHMLAVKSAYRNSDLGRKLKLEQRERVLAQGIDTMTWTFDPLQSLNAHFNFAKLGVVANRYLVNFYGTDARSFLHQNGTDRLWVTWNLQSRRVNERVDRINSDQKSENVALNVETAFEQITRLVQVGDDDFPQSNSLNEKLTGELILIEIPANIGDLERRNSSAATKWREATRRAFTEAFAAGYAVEDFYRRVHGKQQTGVYLLRSS